MGRRLAVAIVILLAAWTTAGEQQARTAQQPGGAQAVEQERAQQATDQLAQAVAAVSAIPLSRTAPQQVIEPCLALETPKDEGFDLAKILSADWLAGTEHTDIPWRVETRSPILRLDQRYEVGYTGKIESQNLKWSSGRHEIRFISGVSDSNGRLLVAKSTKKVFEELPAGRFSVSFSDCVFFQPGRYVLWMAAEDPSTSQHNLIKKNIRIPEWPSGTIADMNGHVPPVEFPEVIGEREKSVPVAPVTMSLPLQDGHPMDIEIVSVMSPGDQWPRRADITRAINSRVLNATAVLSQLRPKPGSVSIAVLDLTHRSMPFEQRNLVQLNWKDIAQVFTNASDAVKVEVSALEALKEHGTFLRATMEQRLKSEAKSRRVIILVSGSLLFAPGSETPVLKSEGECNCRIYHVWLRLTKDDVFNDLRKLIKPLRPTTYSVLTAADFRRAMTNIVEDLDRFAHLPE